MRCGFLAGRIDEELDEAPVRQNPDEAPDETSAPPPSRPAGLGQPGAGDGGGTANAANPARGNLLTGQ